MSTIAFIGLGIMGGPMASHLAGAGHTVIGYDRSPERMAALVEAGGKTADSTEQAVKDKVPGVTCETFEGTRICSRGAEQVGARGTFFFLRQGRVVRAEVAILID